jgi:peptidoglycan-associated lipoprotein
MKKLIAVLAFSALFAGCASQDRREPPPVAEAPKAAPAAPGSTAKISPMTLRGPDVIVVEAKPAPVAPVASGAPGAVAPAPQKFERQPGSVYFDYNRFEVKSEFASVVADHVRKLKDNRAQRVVVEGNADERGSREYNLALGQKRAQSVKRSMVAQGARRSHIETISYGEDRPRATGKDEASYAENRRADVVFR